jgi:lipopolysaccharide/colanic/teichoic acid biosynthesis glycosyltransferase
MKRLFDATVAGLGLLVASPVLLPVMFLVWRQDGHSPFYVADRVGRDGRSFRMVKMRSMVVNADRSGVDSTGADDDRITPIGRFIRRFKIDELTQLWNVLLGDMSVVGPRPNVRRETDLYTDAERRLLSVKPGITDFASVVFADEGEILAGKPDPDIAYNQLIRPGKSRLGLFYVDHGSISVDLQLCWLTAMTLVSRERSLGGMQRLLRSLGADPDLVDLAGRGTALAPLPPPGSEVLVTHRGSQP